MQFFSLTTLWIALGGAVGTVMRHQIGLWTKDWNQSLPWGLPWGTILINATGSFAIAAFAALTVANARLPASSDARLIFMVGICGGYTTFSSFSLQTLDLLRAGTPGRAFLNVALSVALCLGAAASGYAAAQTLNRQAPTAPRVP